MSNQPNLTKRDIVLEIYEKADVSQKQVREIVQMTLDVVADALASGRSVELRNFGVFELQLRKARVGRNPNQPDQQVTIPPRYAVKFKAGKELKAALMSLSTKSK
jgi:nucleoid DNA-binding protein